MGVIKMREAKLFYDKSRSKRRYGSEIGEPWIYDNGVDVYTNNYKHNLSNQAYWDLRHMSVDRFKEYNQKGGLISTKYSDAVKIPETQKLLDRIKYLEKESESSKKQLNNAEEIIKIYKNTIERYKSIIDRYIGLVNQWGNYYNKNEGVINT